MYSAHSSGGLFWPADWPRGSLPIRSLIDPWPSPNSLHTDNLTLQQRYGCPAYRLAGSNHEPSRLMVVPTPAAFPAVARTHRCCSHPTAVCRSTHQAMPKVNNPHQANVKQRGVKYKKARATLGLQQATCLKWIRNQSINVSKSF